MHAVRSLLLSRSTTTRGEIAEIATAQWKWTPIAACHMYLVGLYIVWRSQTRPRERRGGSGVKPIIYGFVAEECNNNT